MTTAEQVLKELEKVSGTDQVRRDLDLAIFDEDVIDSFGAVELMVALANTFGITISPAQIDRKTWATPRKIIAYVEEKIGK